MKYLFMAVVLLVWLFATFVLMLSGIGAYFLFALGAHDKWFEVPQRVIDTTFSIDET